MHNVPLPAIGQIHSMRCASTAGIRAVVTRHGAGSSRASSREWDSTAYGVPLVLGQYQGFVAVVTAGDHDEM
jgi:hypothetical protein